MTDNTVRSRLAHYAGISLGLDNTERLLAYLGHPERSLKFVHIAGTNGKGSVSAYVAHVLTACGYRTGRFNSPAVFDWHETVTVDGDRIGETEAAALADELETAAARMRADGFGSPTRFELETCLAVLQFVRKGCDLAVIETGLGGRLDATNALGTSLVAAITSIGFDHTALLGDSLAEIAGEKAGIIKSGCIVVTAEQTAEAAVVLREKAAKCGCDIVETVRAERVRAGIGGQSMRIGSEIYETALLGDCQLVNLPVALGVLDALRVRGYDLPRETAKHAIAETRWAGRFEVIGRNPTFVIDGAHNEPAVRTLLSGLDEYCSARPRIFLMGVFRDKDYETELALVAQAADKILTFDWANPRALGGAALARSAARYGARAEYAGDIESAVRRGLAYAGTDGVIAAFGSLSHLAEITAVYVGITEGKE